MKFTLAKDVEVTPKVVTLSIPDPQQEYVDIRVNGVVIAELTRNGELWICNAEIAKSVGLATTHGRLKVIS
jgi:hypothetical protein